jgi:hypothetical protein
MFRPLFVSVIGLSLFACGGGAQPAAAPAASSSAPAVAEPAPAPAPPKAETVEDQREAFLGSCMEKTNQKAYCECSFEEFKVVFKDADFSKPLAQGDPRVAQLQERTTKACAGKLPEADIKASFLGACVEGDKAKSPYCECAWTSLRKTIAYTEFVGENALDDARGVEARKTMAADCKGKYPADAAKKDFLQVCMQNAGGSDSACTCRWTKIKKQFTVEQIVAGTADVASVKGLQDCK